MRERASPLIYIFLVQHYFRVYEKFVLEECAAITQKVEGESMVVHNCVVVSMREREGFLDVTFVLSPKDASAYNENDLLLLCAEDPMVILTMTHSERNAWGRMGRSTKRENCGADREKGCVIWCVCGCVCVCV
jgi:hypothetical protein